MLPFKLIRILKITKTVCVCIGLGSVLFTPYFIGKTASTRLTRLMLLIMIVTNLAIWAIERAKRPT